MKNSKALEFKKLEWRDNSTKLGKERGLIYFIGEFFIENHPSKIIEYRICNNYDGILDVKQSLRVFCTENEFKTFDFDEVREAKRYCQIHFEEFITKTFFK